MQDEALPSVYEAFGQLVRLYRVRMDGMTQEKLGQLVGLSRTSITNIEKGRQHVSLYQLYAIAHALRVRPDALLPSMRESSGTHAVARKLPPGTDPEIAEWAEKLIGK